MLMRFYALCVQVLLSIAAVVSLALGFFQDFGTPRPPGEPPVDWVEGVAIIVAIAIVVSLPTPSIYQPPTRSHTHICTCLPLSTPR